VELPLAGNHVFAGSIAGASAPRFMLTLISHGQAQRPSIPSWLADVLARINDHAIHRLESFCRGTGQRREEPS